MPDFILDGNRYPVVTDFTMGQAHEFEKIADCSVERLDKLDEDFHAGCVMAWIAISIKEAKPETPMSQILQRLEMMKVSDLSDVFEDAAGQSPPAETETEPKPSEDGRSAFFASNGGSAIDPAESFPSDTGDPSSGTSADSDLPTFAT